MLTYGFYNSKNNDRKYDAEQLSSIFDGLISDGIYANYKEALKVVPGTGVREIVIRPGRAWFNHTWTLVDDNAQSVYLLGSNVDQVQYIYLCVNKKDRMNSIAGYSTMQQHDEEAGLFFYPIAEVSMPAGSQLITSSMIRDVRGSTACPYVTGVLQTADFEAIVKETCEDNWLVWLTNYEDGLNSKMAAIQAIANEASNVAAYAKNTLDYMMHNQYRWAKFKAIKIADGAVEWYVYTDTTYDPERAEPMPNRILYKTCVEEGSNASLSDPISPEALSPEDQYKNYTKARFFYGDGLDGSTDSRVFAYDAISLKNIVSGNAVTYHYGYRIRVAEPVEGVYEPGDYLGTVSSSDMTQYPKNGYAYGYWYMRYVAQAREVFFNDTVGLDVRTVQEALVALYEMAKTGNGSGSGGGVDTTYNAETGELTISGASYDADTGELTF